MNETQIDTLKWAKQGLATLPRQLDLVFENPPVMMHSIDHEGKLIKVNRAWLQAMGYERDEVLGRKSIDFLTEASRRRAIEETIPLFWKAGEAHSIGYEMVRKDGQCLDLLLDAHPAPIPPGSPFRLPPSAPPTTPSSGWRHLPRSRRCSGSPAWPMRSRTLCPSRRTSKATRHR